MTDVIPGQIVRAVEVSDPRTGAWHLAAELHTANGPVLGRLVGPSDGDAGPVRFEPKPEWQVAAGAPEIEAAGSLGQGPTPAPSGGGTITSADVPLRGRVG